MAKVKHTPTPWVLDKENGVRLPTHIRTEDGYAIADVCRHYSSLSLEELSANAAFMVEAVNNHEALLDIAKEAIWLMQHIMGKKKRIDWGKTFDVDFGHMNDAFIKFEKIRRALKIEVEE